MKKRLLAAVLAMTMVFTMVTPVFAAENPDSDPVNIESEGFPSGDDSTAPSTEDDGAVPFTGEIEVATWDDLKTQLDQAQAGDDLTIVLPEELKPGSYKTVNVPDRVQLTLLAAEGGTTITRTNRYSSELSVLNGGTLTLSGDITLDYNAKETKKLDGAFLSVEAGGEAQLTGAIRVAEGVKFESDLITCNGVLLMEDGAEVSGFTTSEYSDPPAAVVLSGADASFTMEGGTITGNTNLEDSNPFRGAAVQVLDGADFTMNGGFITGNNLDDNAPNELPDVDTQGGGVYVNGSTFTMTGGTISENMASSGGGVYLTNKSSFTMTGGSISENILAQKGNTAKGGGVYVGRGCTFKIAGSGRQTPEIRGNHSVFYGMYRTQAVGGGICVEGTDSQLIADQCLIADNRVMNTAGFAGGGVYATWSASVQITDSRIVNNSGFLDAALDGADFDGFESGGGGIALNGSANLTLSGSEVSGNTALMGAGIYLNGATATIISCDIQNNKTLRGPSHGNPSRGGGIFLQHSGGGALTPPDLQDGIETLAEDEGYALILTGTEDAPTVISGNLAVQDGGGLAITSRSNADVSRVLIQHTVFSKNEAPQGGGAWIDGNTAVQIENSEFSQNTASAAGGISIAENVTLSLTGTDITENSAEEAGGLYSGGTVTMDSGSISRNRATSGPAGGVENGGTFTMTGGTITENSASGAGPDQGIGGGVANLGVFTLSGNGTLYNNTAETGGNDFYNYAEEETEQGGGVVIDPGWDNEHEMELDSLRVLNGSPRAAGGTFSLPDPTQFTPGAKAWFEDAPDDRYTEACDNESALSFTNCAELHYLTLGIETPKPQDWYYEVYCEQFDPQTGTATWVKCYQDIGGNALPDAEVSIDLTRLNGKALSADALDGSGKELLGVHYVYDANYGAHRLNAPCSDATAENPLKVYYRAKLNHVVYQYEGTVPEGADAVLPASADMPYRAPVKIAAAPTLSNWKFSGWKMQSPDYEDLLMIGDGVFLMPNETVTLTGSWTEEEKPVVKHTVTFQPGDHGYLEGAADGGTVRNTVVSGAKLKTVPKAIPSYRYCFTHWLGDDGTAYSDSDILALTITSDLVFTAQYEREHGGGEGGDSRFYKLHYQSNGGPEYKDERYPENTVVELDKIPTREGYRFTGWYADPELSRPITEVKMTSNKTVYAGWEGSGIPSLLNGKDHFAYVIGYSDGTVRPLDNISRAEVAMILFRLLDPEIRTQNLTTFNVFEDVSEDAWYCTAVSTLARMNIVHGRTANTFVPDAPITRAEFAAICARFDESGAKPDDSFTDISGHWAEVEIRCAATLGWIRGYEDGTFRPDQLINRAEAMTMINRMLQRLPEGEDDLLPDMNRWPDNQPGDWFYLAVQEATNSHDFERKSDGVHEYWTEMIADPDWKQYE